MSYRDAPYRDETGLPVESVGEVDWVAWTGHPGPEKATGKIVAAPRTETEKRENTLPYSVIIAWDHAEGRTSWMTREHFRVTDHA